MTRNTIIISAITLLFVACNTTSKLNKQQHKVNVPDTYTENKTTDSSNTAKIKWRDFFDDENLKQLLDTAVINNYDVNIAYQRVLAAKGNVLLNKGAMLPYVRAFGSGGVNMFSDYTMDGAGNIGTRIYDGRLIPKDIPDYLLSFQTSWEVDVWGRLKNKKRAAVARMLSNQEGRNLLITNVIADIATSYYQLLAYDNQLDIIEETITLQTNALEIVKVQKEAAMANQLAVEQFEAQLLALKSMKNETLQQIIEWENRINVLAGRFPIALKREKKGLTQGIPRQIRSGVPYTLLQMRPDIRQAESQLLATQADILAAKAAFYPSLNISGSFGVEAFLPQLLFTTPGALLYRSMGALAAPLINRSILNAELQQANAAQKEALLNYQKTVVNGYTEVQSLMYRIKYLERNLELKKEQTKVLKNAVETSDILFKAGRSTYIEVLIAQQNALKAKLELIDTRKELYQTTANLYKALGGGWQ